MRHGRRSQLYRHVTRQIHQRGLYQRWHQTCGIPVVPEGYRHPSSPTNQRRASRTRRHTGGLRNLEDCGEKTSYSNAVDREGRTRGRDRGKDERRFAPLSDEELLVNMYDEVALRKDFDDVRLVFDDPDESALRYINVTTGVLVI